jgi:DNA helicase-2/ATP-dependent DNA helicase PcrA
MPSKESIFGTEGLGDKKTSLTKLNIQPAFRKNISLNTNKQTAEPDFVPDDLTGLKAGMRVLHQRFGKGVVQEVSAEGINSKAIVLFNESESKTLVLRFAKMKILD